MERNTKVIKLLLLVTLLYQAINAQTLPVTNPKYLVIKEVLEQIANTQLSSRVTPELVVYRDERLIAQFKPRPTPTVYVDEKLYDLCVGMGADSINALAAILGHELAHYYENHDWANGFSDLLELNPTNSHALTLQNKTELEAAADYFGLYYAMLAGYDSFRVLPQILGSIYENYRLPDVLEGYPSRKDRIRMAKAQLLKLKPLIQVFKAGILLYRLHHYSDAAQCFQYLSQQFPSKEILNNLAVCKLAEVAILTGLDEMYFAYPFELDVENRLLNEQAPSRDMALQRKARDLLNEAIRDLEKAVIMDPLYETASINLACAQSIYGNQELAIGTVNQLEDKLNRQQKSLPANASLIRGIARVKNQQIPKAEEDFERAYRLEGYQGQYNLELYRKINQSWQQSLEAWLTHWPVVSQWIGRYFTTEVHEKPVILSRPVQWITAKDLDEDFEEPVRINYGDNYISIYTSLGNNADLLKIQSTGLNQTIYAKSINIYHSEFEEVRTHLGNNLNELKAKKGPPENCLQSAKQNQICNYPQMMVKLSNQDIKSMTAVKFVAY